MSQLTIYSDPDFIKRQERALRHFKVFCLVRSGNWFEWILVSRMPMTQGTDKITQRPRCRSCWSMPCAWVQGQTSKTDCHNMSSGDPRSQFPRAVLSAEASTHIASPSALRALVLAVSASLEPVECHLTSFQMFTYREFSVLVWIGCLSFLLAVDL